jgi:hypothetical protein
MSRPSIDYMNARRALMPASGGAKQDHSAKYAPDDNTDGVDIARNAIGAFILWAECERQRYLAAVGLSEPEPDPIPF